MLSIEINKMRSCFKQVLTSLRVTLSALDTESTRATREALLLVRGIVDGFAYPGDHLFPSGFVSSGVRDENSYCKLPTIRQSNQPNVIGCMSHSVVYVRASAFVSHAGPDWEISVETSRRDGGPHPI
jgi:hypothetical protein